MLGAIITGPERLAGAYGASFRSVKAGIRDIGAVERVFVDVAMALDLLIHTAPPTLTRPAASDPLAADITYDVEAVLRGVHDNKTKLCLTAR